MAQHALGTVTGAYNTPGLRIGTPISTLDQVPPRPRWITTRPLPWPIPSETDKFHLATDQSGDTAGKPFLSETLRPAALHVPVVGQGEARPCPRQRRKKQDRRARFFGAVELAYAMDWPLTTALTVSWDALLQAGDHNEGHCLGRGVWHRERYLRTELARLCRSEGIPFVALWGRDIGRDVGSHVHLSMFWPTRHLPKLVGLLERVTGSSADFVLLPYSADIVGRSVCGGWQINTNRRRDQKASALDWAEYIADQHDKHPASPELEGKAFGISAAIGTAAQKKAIHMLEAREAQHGWMKGTGC